MLFACFYIGAGTSLVFLTGLSLMGKVNAECKSLSINIVVDDYMILYVDGAPITGLPNAFNWDNPNTVNLTCATRVIAIQGVNMKLFGGIRASDNSGYILTNSSWKCTNVSYPGWEKIDFDDSSWPDAVAIPWGSGNLKPGLNSNSVWIWSSDWNVENDDFLPNSNIGIFAYCRKNLAVNECALDPLYNQCNSSTGTCEDTLKGYNCHCLKGYTNTNGQTCEDVDECLLSPPNNVCDIDRQLCVNLPGSYRCISYNDCNNTGLHTEEPSKGQNLIVIILGVLLGVSVIVNVVQAIYTFYKSRRQMKEPNVSSRTESVPESTKANTSDPYDVLRYGRRNEDHPYQGMVQKVKE